MTERTSPNVEVIDLAPGLWIWRIEHPGWNPHVDWQEVVTCVCADAVANGGYSIRCYRPTTQARFGTASTSSRQAPWRVSPPDICPGPSAAPKASAGARWCAAM